MEKDTIHLDILKNLEDHIVGTKAGYNYYKSASEFKERIQEYKLTDLTGKYAIDENGNQIEEFGNYKIFYFEDSNGTSIEDPNSNFNQQRLAVIKYSIEKNLSIAIANYNTYGSETKVNFQMPKLKEDEWEKILNNISIISFLQGLNIGGKIYNGYSIINNNKNNEVVNEDSIYITTDDNKYHRANDNDLINKTIGMGVLNIDFEIKSGTKNDGTTIDFMPKSNGNSPYVGCYSSIVDTDGINETNNMYKYMEEMAKKGNAYIPKEYFTALGRERQSMYRTDNDIGVTKTKTTVKQEEYTITYNANEGTGGPTSQKKTKGKDIILSNEEPQRNGYKFLGWGINNNSTNVSYAPGAVYANDSNIELYAIWKRVIKFSNGYKTVQGTTSTSWNWNTKVKIPANTTVTFQIQNHNEQISTICGSWYVYKNEELDHINNITGTFTYTYLEECTLKFGLQGNNNGNRDREPWSACLTVLSITNADGDKYEFEQ